MHHCTHSDHGLVFTVSDLVLLIISLIGFLVLQVSDLKKNEMSGSIVFGSSTSEQPRSAIGGVRKPPGGGSSLSFGDAPSKSGSNTDGDASSGRKTPGGHSSFSFGW